MIGLQVFISTDTNHSKTKKKQSWQAETYEDLNKTQHFRLPWFGFISFAMVSVCVSKNTWNLHETTNYYEKH